LRGGAENPTTTVNCTKNVEEDPDSRLKKKRRVTSTSTPFHNFVTRRTFAVTPKFSTQEVTLASKGSVESTTAIADDQRFGETAMTFADPRQAART